MLQLHGHGWWRVWLAGLRDMVVTSGGLVALPKSLIPSSSLESKANARAVFTCTAFVSARIDVSLVGAYIQNSAKISGSAHLFHQGDEECIIKCPHFLRGLISIALKLFAHETNHCFLEHFLQGQRE